MFEPTVASVASDSRHLSVPATGYPITVMHFSLRLDMA